MKYILFFICFNIFAQANGHIFVYHRFDDSRYKSANTTTKQLISQFEYFKNNNYKVVPLIDIVQKIKAKEKISDKWVAFCIDDGFRSFYKNALPLFKEFNYPFTLFIAVKYTDKNYKDYVTWKQLKEIKKYGSIEFHSYGHGHFAEMNDTAIKADMDKGLALIKKFLNYKPSLFVYPYGEYDNRVQKVIEQYGFEAVFNQNIGAVNAECSNAYDIDRSALVGKAPFKLYLKFKELCGVTFKKPLKYPSDKIIKTIEITLKDKSITDAEIYISNNGWHRVKVKDGKIVYYANKKVKLKRIKIGIKVRNRIKLMVLSKW